jgi:non-heme chloroperoxidase
MLRRHLLKSLATLGGGPLATFGATSAGPGSSTAASKPRGARSRREDRYPSFVETTDGARLFYRQWGTGRPVVFLPPWALNSSWWEYHMTQVAGQGFRAISYDRRGHGRSSEPVQGYELDSLADDLARLLETLDLREVTLVGHSMGAGEAVRYLAGHGQQRVTRLVLVAPITPFTLKTTDNPDGVERTALDKARASLASDRPGVIAHAAPAFFGTEKNTVSSATLDWWTATILHQCSLKVMLDLHRAFTETDFRPDLRAITIPTLVVHGDIDTSTLLERTGRPTAALIRNSRLEVYEGAAHGLPITHKDRLNRDLLEFMGA